MIINKQKIGAMVTASSILIFPLVVMGAETVGIPCGEYVDGKFKECGFNDLITLANNIINFLIYYVAVPVAALGFMWVGANLVLNQDKKHEWDAAKEGFLNMVKGFFIMIAAFVLIKFVLFQFLSDVRPEGGGKSYVDFMQFILE